MSVCNACLVVNPLQGMPVRRVLKRLRKKFYFFIYFFFNRETRKILISNSCRPLERQTSTSRRCISHPKIVPPFRVEVKNCGETLIFTPLECPKQAQMFSFYFELCFITFFRNCLKNVRYREKKTGCTPSILFFWQSVVASLQSMHAFPDDFISVLYWVSLK